ncbi:MAG: hypothetical protein Q9168_007253, partial [Polycauliona sp. 1 TL-2023]
EHNTRPSQSLLDPEPSGYGTASEPPASAHLLASENGAPTDSNAIIDELSTTQLAIILGSTYLGIILAALDGTMVATLTASISSDYNSLTLLAWLASAYYIANSVLQPLAGKLTDIYGRRAGLVLCNLLFCAGNLICGLAQSESLIIFGRGANNICFGVGSGLGGIYGGWLNDTIGWRAAFLILAPFTLLSGILVAIFARLPTTEVKDIEGKWRRVDVLGSLVLVSAIILLLLGLNSGGNTVPWTHPLVVVSLPISLVLFVGFAYVEVKVAVEPVIPVKLLLNQTVLAACLTSWFFSMAQLALTFYAPIFFQIQGKSAKQAGLLLIPTSVGAAVGGIASGMMIRASGRYYMLNLLVQVLFLVPLGLATRFDLRTPVILPIVYFFFTGLSYAGKLTITVTALIAAVEQKHQAVITSASYACPGTGSAIGIAVCSLVFQNTLKRRLWEEFGAEDGAASLIGRLRDNLKEIKYLPNNGWMAGAEDAYMDALTNVFWTIFGLAAVGTVASLFMREHTLHKSLARRDSQ